MKQLKALAGIFFLTTVSHADIGSCETKAHNYVRAIVGIENSLNYFQDDTLSLLESGEISVMVAANGNYPNLYTYNVKVDEIDGRCTILNIQYVDVDGEGPNGN